MSILWVGTGSEEVPDDLVDEDGNVVHPGAVEGVVDPFTPPNQPCPAEVVNPPVTRVSGGSVGPEFALISFDVVIPAGSTWVAFQLESPQDNNGESGVVPESGSWASGGLLIIPTLAASPGISLEKTVLDGADGACPGVEGTDELASTATGAPVSYCFRVENTGETALFPVLLDDSELAATQDDMTLVSGDDTVPLPVGGELVYALEATIDDDLVNTATVTGTPVDDDGEPFDPGEDVADTNQAEVRVDVVPEIPVPDVLVEKTVLVGGGAECPGVEGIDEQVTGVATTPVTWCVRVVNTGAVALFPVVVDDPELGMTQEDMTLVVGDDTVPVEPGGELVYAVDDTVESDLRNTVEVTGTPVDGQPPVTDDNDASVVLRVRRVLGAAETAAPITPSAPITAPLVAPTTPLLVLPRTGMEVPALSLLALGLLLAGGLVVVRQRRRTRSD